MQAIDMSVWQGRIDATEGSLAPRWHQAMRPIARDTDAGTVVLIGFACDAGVARNQGRTGAAGGPAAIRHAAQYAGARMRAAGGCGQHCCAGDELEAAQIELSKCVAGQLRPDAFRLCSGAGMKWHWAVSLDWRRIWRASKRCTHRHRQLRRTFRSAARRAWQLGYAFLADRALLRGTRLAVPLRLLRRQSIFEYARALFVRAQKLGVVFVRDEQMQSAQQALATFVSQVDHVYLTFCLDVLPAPIAPGVSAPAVRGVGLDIVEPLIDLVIDSRKLRLADIAEMNPRFDIDHQTAAVAARVVARIANESRVAWDSLWTNVHLATMAPPHPYGEIRNAALAVHDGKIAWLGPLSDLPAGAGANKQHDGAGGWITPGLIDCHTHIVYAGNRSESSSSA